MKHFSYLNKIFFLGCTTNNHAGRQKTESSSNDTTELVVCIDMFACT